MVFYDPIGCCHPKSPTLKFCGEKGFKNTFYCFFIYAFAIILDCQADIWTWF